MQRLPAKVPSCEFPSSKDLSPITDCSIPESHPNGQACFPGDVVWESSAPQQNQEAPDWGWALRKNHKTRVYSGRRRLAAGLQQKPHLGLHAEEPPGTWDVAHCQAGKDIVGPVQPEEKSWPENQTCMQTYSHPSPTHACSFRSPKRRDCKDSEPTSKALKRSQARQTMMISFYNQHKSPGQQGEPGPRGVASTQNSHSLPESPASPRAQTASYLTSGERSTKKTQAKRTAPLMAKALRDYSKRFSKK